jgi:hypothetical protein
MGLVRVPVMVEVRRRRTVVMREMEVSGRREKGERARKRVRAATTVMMRVLRLRAGRVSLRAS